MHHRRPYPCDHHFHLRLLLLCATLLASPLSRADLFEKEVIFTEADIQSALAKAKPVQLSYGGLLAVAMNAPPTILLDGTDGRARIATALDVEVQQKPPVRVDVSGRAGIRYDETRKAFFLENPVVDSAAVPELHQAANAAVRRAASQLLASYCRTRPVYVLRADSSPQEATARWLLKSVRIEPGRVVAVMSPF